MTPISFNNPYGGYGHLQPAGKQNSPVQTPVSGQLFYGADGQQQIPDVAGINKDGAERSHNDANGNQSSLAGNESKLTGNKSILGNADDGKCETCESRKYQDGSNDPGVSFKTATKLSPEEAAVAVRSHENEHVVRNQAKAEREGREVVSQSVTLHTAICPECGEPYISGGTTRTVTRADNQQESELSEKFQAGLNEEKKGQFLDLTA